MLVGLDGSPNADEALEQAVHLAQRFKAKIVLAHVQETHGIGRRASDSGDLLQRAEERVGEGGVKAGPGRRRGDAGEELAARAREADAVLGGRRGGSSPR